MHVCMCIYTHVCMHVFIVLQLPNHLYVGCLRFCMCFHFFFNKSLFCIVLKLSLPGQLLHELPLSKSRKKIFSAVLGRFICCFCVVLIVNNILPNVLQRTDVNPFQAMDRMMLNMRNSMQEIQRNFVSTKKLMRTLFSVIGTLYYSGFQLF